MIVISQLSQLNVELFEMTERKKPGPKPKDKPPRAGVLVYLPPGLADWLQEYASKEVESRTSLITRILLDFAKKKGFIDKK